MYVCFLLLLRNFELIIPITITIHRAGKCVVAKDIDIQNKTTKQALLKRRTMIFDKCGDKLFEKVV